MALLEQWYMEHRKNQNRRLIEILDNIEAKGKVFTAHFRAHLDHSSLPSIDTLMSSFYETRLDVCQDRKWRDPGWIAVPAVSPEPVGPCKELLI